MTTHAATRRVVAQSPIAGGDYRRTFARRGRRSDALVIALWASGAAAAALFLASGGLSQFSSIAEIVTSVGILAGLIGTDFILVMLVLAARIPLIDATIGHDRAIALHRSLGKPALYLLLAHAALLLTGYGLSSGINPIAEIGSMLTLPDMPLAFIALGLLIVVVVTSLIAVRKRFSYEAWHLIHLLSYASVLFALPHQLSVGGVLAEGSFQRAYWISLYIVAIGGIVTFRFAKPIVSSLRHRLRVSSVTEIAPGVTTIEFSGRRLRALGTSGGQFFIWRFWTGRTWWHSHPISLSSMPNNLSARITVRALGKGSAQLATLPMGTRVSIEGPYGLFSSVARTSPKLAIIAAGIGVTPVRALLENAALAPGEATVLLRASTTEETYHWDEIRAIAAAQGTTCYSMIGHRPQHTLSWMAAADAERGVTLATAFPDLTDSDVYLCGPTPWLDLVEADVRATGIHPHQVHPERFDW
ncbi:ferric reductase-like transmembrane domain-containing protein [Salinibacterium sp. NSLL150]|uniref:ferredoxin reductase family protein n=1 Tax=unclassified Salinibacterium TaxID=2632331 RepID=UPI0018CD2620|nr:MULTISPECIES: ferredoxin reductase family protein [unclassified Salinibacterium]MBH0100020.1 ferric reductase-like transmembrane domain-containing protein [Salinibacterium sp. NSLL35]MBH0102774.1 ferric reductase-like transmembrane domain-containing protein [Salinibacterium sp. NSLL150]MBH0105534.1 ferric reductase-like transmembrane domain-containing protein [Salinibacterium sp. NSLL16]MBH0108294.1 ferric reductase-like transmembrane domain-containing protein [Salinibacterium sp. NSLL17]